MIRRGHRVIVLDAIWRSSVQLNRAAGWKEDGTTVILCGCWFVWKQRKERMFSNTRVPPFVLAEQISTRGTPMEDVLLR